MYCRLPEESIVIFSAMQDSLIREKVSYSMGCPNDTPVWEEKDRDRIANLKKVS